ncbi:PspC domain-containing protein [Pelagibaculum spongiae]|uniref:Phage shock protein PspC N-terminal domain-containing protein n=1 Tax=Pelagibaculum spongiae TaxID=2080658 RepID=A0A2V1GY69_9GAMM|nr:PspC domain-containing protein [Pelagibaculum spongiae]PVZ70277.1 hypothetical protein DC094_06675 [Pelagibaculum spongiae]
MKQQTELLIKAHGQPVILGLCHLTAKKFDLDVILVRLAAILLTYFISAQIFTAYIVIGIVVKISQPKSNSKKIRKVKKKNVYQTVAMNTQPQKVAIKTALDESRLTRASTQAFARKISRLEQRLQKLEQHTTSSHFQLNQAFNHLKNNNSETLL